MFGNEVGERVGRVMTAWRAECRRAKITDLHFHDLRREFASRLLESGASDYSPLLFPDPPGGLSSYVNRCQPKSKDTRIRMPTRGRLDLYWKRTTGGRSGSARPA